MHVVLVLLLQPKAWQAAWMDARCMRMQAGALMTTLWCMGATYTPSAWATAVARTCQEASYCALWGRVFLSAPKWRMCM